MNEWSANLDSYERDPASTSVLAHVTFTCGKLAETQTFVVTSPDALAAMVTNRIVALEAREKLLASLTVGPVAVSRAISAVVFDGQTQMQQLARSTQAITP